ncbi:MAG TPA: beta-N-acetylhexosaminidase [Acholeplasmataceae bacterium]|nr:beta-N-acetylhexosaminidase [Acholeplasmataceae bacterium]
MSKYDINKLTIKEKIGQVSMYGIEATEITEDTINLIKEYRVGNIILFARNVESPEQLFKLNQGLQRLAKEEFDIPMFISIDQEGGMVTRIFNGSTFFPGAMTISATNNPENAYEMGKIMGKELKALGVNMNLAPILDVNNNPHNPVIGVRSFSDKPEVVAEYGWLYSKGMQEEGVFATAKHFPGHGDTNVDSHLGLPTITHDRDRLDNFEFLPFKYAINQGIEAIMSSHINFTKLTKDGTPVTLSREVMTDLLRGEFGFEGLIVSDSMTMKGVVQRYSAEDACVIALNAGLNLICVCHPTSPRRESLDRMYEAVMSGEISEEVLNERVLRVLKAKEKLGEINLDLTFEDVKAVAINDEHKKASYQITEDALTLVKGRTITLKDNALFVGYLPRALTIADDTDGTSFLGKRLNQEISNLDTKIIELSPSDELIEKLIEEMDQYDQIILTTYSGNTQPQQIKLINEAHKLNKEIHVISMRDPYDLYYTKAINNYVCLYEYTPNSIEVLIKYLKGEITPKGKIPIEYE